MFLHMVCLLSLAVALPSNAATSSKPGCESTCGNLQVPYPFGIASGIGIPSNCSMSSEFNIYCNTISYPPKAYLPGVFPLFEVVNISETKIYVKNREIQHTFSCYGSVSTRYRSTPFDYLSSTPYTLSDANQLTAFGCDDLAIRQNLVNMSSTYGAGASSCLIYCASKEGMGSCPGDGCCQTSVVKGKKSMTTRLIDMGPSLHRPRFFRCSFLTLGMINISGFTFPLSDLNDSAFLNKYPALTDTPLVLDWTIGSQNCSEMRNSSSYACKENSYCVDSDAGVQGYHCKCREGYDGTPYVSPGCLDINECLDSPFPCDPNGICVNTPGSYNCSCRNGYYGDGTREGTGCIRTPGSNSIVAIGASLGAGMGFLLLLLACFWLLKFLKKRKNKKQKEKFFKRNGGLLLQQQISKHEDILEKTRLFTARDLDMATDHFNKSRILGQGGQGTVYKGMISDGKLVAVKKSKLVDENQVEQFINEVVILSEINQRNVVKLLGCCLETEVPLLVYEFIPNGTLFNLIHDDSAEFPFSWNMRLKIAVEVAGALAYLHYTTSVPIYHRDIKSSNILLDEKYVAKVSDFGTSRSIEVDKTHLTTLVKGTFGYLDPEYFQSSQFTEKSDVYSFGVVLVELLTGKRPISSDGTEEERSLATRFLLCMERNDLEAILDAQVLEQGKREELTAVAKVAQRCLNLNGKNRPTMKEVAMELEGIKMSQSVETTFEGVRLLNSKSVMLPDADYTWTSTSESTFRSSDVSPFMAKTF